MWCGVAAAAARAVALARTSCIALTAVPRSSSGATVGLLRRRIFIATTWTVSHDDAGSRHDKDECERQYAARGAEHRVQLQRIQNALNTAQLRMRLGAPYSQDFYRRSIDLTVANWGYRVKNRFCWLRGPGKLCGLSQASNQKSQWAKRGGRWLRAHT